MCKCKYVNTPNDVDDKKNVEDVVSAGLIQVTTVVY